MLSRLNLRFSLKYGDREISASEIWRSPVNARWSFRTVFIDEADIGKYMGLGSLHANSVFAHFCTKSKSSPSLGSDSYGATTWKVCPSALGSKVSCDTAFAT